METTGFAGSARPLSQSGDGDAEGVVIARLALSGEGVAEDGMRVPFGLPGERVAGRLEHGALRLEQVLAPSPDRIAPACRHFGTCGGCSLQHGSDAFVAAWKAQVVTRALAARGLAAPVGPVLTSPPRSRRRAVFAGRRTRSGVVIGFHAARSPAVVALAACAVIRPELLAARPVLGALTALGASRSRPLRLAVTLAETGLDVSVSEGRPLDGALRAEAASLADAHDLARLAWDGEVIVARRPAWQSMGRARVVPPPGGFLQATPHGEAALVDGVRRAVGDARRIADLFAGCGTFALPLAEAADVHAVEGAADHLAALEAGWRGARGLRRVSTECRDLFRRPLRPDELARFDAVVLDPPRAGAEAQARTIAASGVARVAAVSCNPVTFARDVRILADSGFRLGPVSVIDQFRWSPHVEIVAALAR